MGVEVEYHYFFRREIEKMKTLRPIALILCSLLFIPQQLSASVVTRAAKAAKAATKPGATKNPAEANSVEQRLRSGESTREPGKQDRQGEHSPSERQSSESSVSAAMSDPTINVLVTHQAVQSSGDCAKVMARKGVPHGSESTCKPK